MNRKLLSLLLAIALAGGLASLTAASAKGKNPSLQMRVSPRAARSPVSVLAIAELKGGEDVEEYYCLGVEWDWDDGSKSFQDSDCDPYEPGMKIDRRFSSDHYYSRPGKYNVVASLISAKGLVARRGVALTVREGIPQYSPGY